MYHAYDKGGTEIPYDADIKFDEYMQAEEAAGSGGFVVENVKHWSRNRDVTTLYAHGDEGTVTMEVVFNDNPMIFLSVNGRSTSCLRIVEARHMRNLLDEKIKEAEKIHAEYMEYYKEDE